MDLQTRIATWFGERVVRRPGTILLVTLAIVALGATLATRLYINTNTLDLISQDLRQVKDVKRVIDMVGGVGHMIVALRGSDEAALKAVGDDLDAMFEADDANVRTSFHKLDASFLRERAGLLVKTDDLEELKRRVDVKLADLTKRANPFFFEIVPSEPVELKVDDIVDKYRSIGKKRIDDDYYISEDRQMLLVVVKPMWNNTELDKTGEYMETLRARFAKYGAENGRGFRLVEDYDGVPHPDGKVVQFGFTGSYPLSFDDAHQIKQSLIPVSSIAFVGVLLVLLLFFGRYFAPVLLIMLGLSAGISITYGFAAATVGELNMITAILAGILTGNGEDFGVFVAYRLREEFKEDVPIEDAIKRTIVHAGPASFVSAAGSGVAFLSLLFSEFRGFSQFGLLAGMGIFIIGLTIYAVMPSAILVIDRWFPGAARRMLGPPRETAEEAKALDQKSIPYPRAILAVAVTVTLALVYFAKDVTFDYNSRALMVENQPTMMMQDELNRRMKMSADPVGIWTPTPAEAKRVYDYFKVNVPKLTTVDQAVSLYTFIPSPEQQTANAAILKQWKEELSRIDPGMLPDEYRGRWDEVMKLLSAQPYDLDTVPKAQADIFKALPGAKPENQGWLTFVYPTVDLWNGKQLLKFADEVEDVDLGGGTVYHSAGMPVLMATLARIVLRDARMFVGLTMVLLFLILLADLRNVGSAIVALLPLAMGGGIMLGVMGLFDIHLNFMNIVVFPIVLAYGVSQGVYLIHRFNEGTAPRHALNAVGTAVVCSTLTTLAGWAALMVAPHKGLQTMGLLACIGMTSVLVVTFTVMPAILQILHDKRLAEQKPAGGGQGGEDPPAPANVPEARVA